MINILLLLLGLTLAPTPIAQAKTLPPSFPIAEEATTTPALVARYSALYGVSGEDMTRVLTCESGGLETAYNGSDPQGGAKGIAQFLQPTFNTWSKRAGIINGDVWNKEDSVHTMAYMFSKNQQGQWSCWKKNPAN